MNLKDRLTGADVYDKITLEPCIELGKAASRFLKINLPYPHNMEYEKIKQYQSLVAVILLLLVIFIRMPIIVVAIFFLCKMGFFSFCFGWRK